MSDNIIKEGYLSYFSTFWNIYEKRWVVITNNNKLQILSKKNSPKILFELDLNTFNCIKRITNTTKYKKNDFQIMIYTDKNTSNQSCKLRASTENEIVNWLNYIQQSQQTESNQHIAESNNEEDEKLLLSLDKDKELKEDLENIPFAKSKVKDTQTNTEAENILSGMSQNEMNELQLALNEQEITEAKTEKTLDSKTRKLLTKLGENEIDENYIQQLQKYFTDELGYITYESIKHDINLVEQSMILNFCMKNLSQPNIFITLYNLIQDDNFDVIENENLEEKKIEIDPVNDESIDKVQNSELILETKQLDISVDKAKNDSQFILNWNHIGVAMRHWLYPKLSTHFSEAVQECKVGENNFSDRSITIILTHLKEKKNLRSAQVNFMEKLINNSTTFDPLQQTQQRNNKNNKSLDFDTNGIIYWLGTIATNGKSKWRNPAIQGNVKIYASSLGHGSEPAHSIVGGDAVRCFTDNRKKSWFMIDLLNVDVKLTHYSLRHYVSQNTNCLRNWILEGSTNSTNGINGDWQVLSLHKNDKSLNRKGDTHKWEIYNAKFYSQFRIQQIGANSAGRYNLVLSGFEIYGSAKIRQNNVSVENNENDKKGKIFIYKHDFDENGLLYHLGTVNQTQKYHNPADIEQVNVSSTSLHFYSHPISTFVGRKLTNCMTKSIKESWMRLDLKNIKMKLTNYTLKHNNSDSQIIRNWNLE
eukprot:11196_1